MVERPPVRMLPLAASTGTLVFCKSLTPTSPLPFVFYLLLKAKERKKALSKRLGRPVNTDGQYEDVIAQEVVNPAHINVTLRDVGGLDHIIEDLRRNVITPMRRPELFRTSLLRQKRGVLLYGPPGTGKTMLAKALAAECDACFINLKASTLLSKWYGDTNKLIAAVWTLAAKIAPTILFIDEVDSLLGHRRAVEHEATTAMKTEFMQLWDGFETQSAANIVVLGATNKRDDLDEAVLRRFSLQYEVRLPRAPQRATILALLLARHARELGPQYLDPGLWAEVRERAGLVEAHPPEPASERSSSSSDAGPTLPPRPAQGKPGTTKGALKLLAERTEGYSGSDLTELCSMAAAVPFHDAAASQ